MYCIPNPALANWVCPDEAKNTDKSLARCADLLQPPTRARPETQQQHSQYCVQLYQMQDLTVG